MRALVYGAMNPDLVHVVVRTPRPGDDIRSTSWRLTWGGKATNAAMALAAWEVDTRLLGLMIGKDPLGDAFMELIDHPHLDRTWIVRDADESTRHCVILLTPTGDRTIICTGYDGARWQAVPDRAWDGVDVALIDGLAAPAAARAVIAEAADRRIPVVWLDAPEAAADTVDLVVWSQHEHDAATAERLSARGANIVLTAGPDPITFWASGEGSTITPPQLAPIDSTGAGDVFAAACARGIATGDAPEQYLRWAAAAGAATAASGRDTLPTRAAIDALLRTRP